MVKELLKGRMEVFHFLELLKTERKQKESLFGDNRYQKPYH